MLLTHFAARKQIFEMGSFPHIPQTVRDGIRPGLALPSLRFKPGLCTHPTQFQSLSHMCWLAMVIVFLCFPIPTCFSSSLCSLTDYHRFSSPNDWSSHPPPFLYPSLLFWGSLSVHSQAGPPTLAPQVLELPVCRARSSLHSLVSL